MTRTTRAIVAAFAAAVAATLLVLLFGWAVLGDPTAWTEGQGRTVGLLATVAAALGAALGSWCASREGSRPTRPSS